jgi:hypothetical protein
MSRDAQKALTIRGFFVFHFAEPTEQPRRYQAAHMPPRHIGSTSTAFIRSTTALRTHRGEDDLIVRILPSQDPA